MTEMTIQFNGVEIRCEGEEYLLIKRKAIELKIEIETAPVVNDYIRLPIHKIDGISCLVKIVYNRTLSGCSLGFKIESSIVQIYDDDIDEYDPIDLLSWSYRIGNWYDNTTIPQETYIEFLMKVKYLLANLKFDKLTSELTLKPSKNQLFYDLFDCENITMDASICSVCLELTNHKTFCGHSVCYRCIEGIRERKKEPAECCGDGCTCMYRPCPECRGDMMMKPDEE